MFDMCGDVCCCVCVEVKYIFVKFHTLLHGSVDGTQVSRLESMRITIPYMLSHLTDLIVQ